MTVVEIFENLESALQYMHRGDEAFYSSLKNYYRSQNRLSGSQEYHLNRLAQKYSPEELSIERKFAESYSDNERLTAVRIAHYYDAKFPRYFGDLVDKILEAPGEYALTHKQYNKMCNNKYAKKILAVYSAPIRFSVGEIVKIRANNRLDLANIANDQSGCSGVLRDSSKDKACLVLEVTTRPITRPSRGSRIYKILITDKTRPIYAHESDLKNNRRSKQ